MLYVNIYIYICIIYIVFSLKRGHTWLYSIFVIEWDIINNFWEKKNRLQLADNLLRFTPPDCPHH